MRLKLFTLIALVLTTGSIFAQDIHFTQYNMSPMTLNPAMIGKFEGTVRIGGIFRGQWASVIGSKNQYKTPSAWVDAPIIRGFRKRDWVGVGLVILADKSGSLGLVHNSGKLGAAYHLSLNKKGTAYLSIGGNYGGEQRGIDATNAEFGQGLKAGNVKQDPDFLRLQGVENQKYSDADVGVALSAKLNKTMDFVLGFSMYHLLRPDFSLLGAAATPPGPNPPPATPSATEDVARRPVVHGTFNAKLNDKFTISPSFMFQTMSGADEIQLQGMAGYLFNQEKDITLKFGAGYRMRDAVQLLVGAQVKNLQLGLAYDINTSDLVTASNYRGGFELAANYIIKIYKPAKAKTKVLCPRF